MLYRSILVSVCCALVALSVTAATATAEIVIPRPQAAPVEVQIDPALPSLVTVPRSVTGTDEVAPEVELKLDNATRDAVGAEEQDLAAVGTAAGELLEALARSCLAGAFQVAAKDLASALGVGGTINVDDELQKAFAACFTRQLTSQGVPAPAAQAAGASLGKAFGDDATAAAAAAAGVQGDGNVYASWLTKTGTTIANAAPQQTAVSTATVAAAQPTTLPGSTTQGSSTPSPGLIVAALMLFGGATVVLVTRRLRK